MECSCGGKMSEHTVQKNLKMVGFYAKCVSCGRIHWWKKPKGEKND